MTRPNIHRRTSRLIPHRHAWARLRGLRFAARGPSAERKESFLCYPAFTPQRALLASETYRATIRLSLADWNVAGLSLSFSLEKIRTTTLTPGTLVGCLSFNCAEAARNGSPARAFAPRACTRTRQRQRNFLEARAPVRQAQGRSAKPCKSQVATYLHVK
jgi:hypothetical protein